MSFQLIPCARHILYDPQELHAHVIPRPLNVGRTCDLLWPIKNCRGDWMVLPVITSHHISTLADGNEIPLLSMVGRITTLLPPSNNVHALIPGAYSKTRGSVV